MKKIISIIVVFFTLVSITLAQPSTALFKQVMQLSGQMETLFDQGPEALDQLVMVAKMSNPSLTDEEAKTKMQEYLKSQFFDDITALSLPYYTSLTDADCEVLIKSLGAEEMQDVMKRITASSAKSQSQMSVNISSSMQQVMTGATPEAVAYNEAPASLVKKFDEYADLIGLEATMDGALNSVKQQMTALLPDNMKEQMEKTLKVAFDYLRGNIRPMTFNLMSATVTEQDLQRYIDLFSTPAGQHMVEGNKALSNDVVNFSMQYMQKMVEYMK